MRDRIRTIELLLLGLLTVGAVLFSASGESLKANAELAPDSTSQGQMPPDFDAEVARVVAELDQIEADTLRQMDKTTLDRQGQIHTLGKLMLFDKHLSVNQNEACSFCHTPETGFTGPIQSSESKHRIVSRVGENAIQPAKAAELHVRDLRACAPLQRPARRLRRRKFLGHARQRLSFAESKRRTSPGASDQPSGNGPA